MPQSSTPHHTDSFFLWSAKGIRRVQNGLRQALKGLNVPGLSENSLRESDLRRYPRLDLRIPILYKILGRDTSFNNSIFCC